MVKMIYLIGSSKIKAKIEFIKQLCYIILDY